MKYTIKQKVVRKGDAGKFVGKPLFVADFYTSNITGKEIYEVTEASDDTEEREETAPSFLCKEEDIVSAGEHLKEILDAELVDEEDKQP